MAKYTITAVDEVKGHVSYKLESDDGKRSTTVKACDIPLDLEAAKPILEAQALKFEQDSQTTPAEPDAAPVVSLTTILNKTQTVELPEPQPEPTPEQPPTPDTAPEA